MNIMIIGPITGIGNYQRNFGYAEGELNGLYPHAHVLNPCALDMSGLPWADCMKITLMMLKVCDAVYVLQGFENSKGAMREYDAAARYHKKILFQEVKSHEE